jgi:hypothetical protein
MVAPNSGANFAISYCHFVFKLKKDVAKNVVPINVSTR